jgi:hypothetical protein
MRSKPPESSDRFLATCSAGERLEGVGGKAARPLPGGMGGVGEAWPQKHATSWRLNLRRPRGEKVQRAMAPRMKIFEARSFRHTSAGDPARCPLSDVGSPTGAWPPAATCCGHLRSGPRCSPERHGWTSSAPVVERAARLISVRSTGIRSHRSGRLCSACGARGVRDRRRCRSCWGCTLCRRCRPRALIPSGRPKDEAELRR